MKTLYLKLKGAVIAGILLLAGLVTSGCKKEPMVMYGCPEDDYRPRDTITQPDSVPAPNPLEETL